MQEKLDLNKTKNFLKNMAKNNTMMISEEQEQDTKPRLKAAQTKSEIREEIGEEIETLKSELAEIKEMLAYIITNKTIVNESDNSTVDLVIAGTHFRGKMSRVVK
jgi:hypothetical protein